MLMSITVEGESVPHPQSKILSRGNFRDLPAEVLRPGGSKERELFDPGFDAGGKPSTASSAKVSEACRIVGDLGSKLINSSAVTIRF